MGADSGTNTYNGKNYYSLNDKSGPLIKLVNLTQNNPKVTVTNKDTSTLPVWSKVVWTTALYDFKTRKFKCDYIEYSSLGRVKSIYFSEF